VRVTTRVEAISITAGKLDSNAPRLVTAIEGAWTKLTATSITNDLTRCWQTWRDKEVQRVKLTLKACGIAVQPNPVPSIVLLPNLDHLASSRVAAQRRAIEFWFSSAYITKMPHGLLLALVGHELIHAHRWVTESRLDDTKAEEKIVMQLTQDYGFDQEGLLKWFGRRRLSAQ
jgi:hypothetical protein